MQAVVDWDTFVGEWQQPLYNFSYRLLGNATDAEDATQDIFLRLFEKFDLYRDACFQTRVEELRWDDESAAPSGGLWRSPPIGTPRW